MKHLDLFSGIGGFALAAQWTWGDEYETVAFCEIDKFCHKVLRKNFGDVPIYEDIKKLDGTKLTNIDLLTGGFPCQPFSVAGKRKGNEDDRALWPEMLRIIQEVKPRWIIGENVAGFVNMALDQSITDLENEGYEVRAFIIPACAVNAPHRRDRVWIVANRQENGLCGNPKQWKNNGMPKRVMDECKTERRNEIWGESERSGENNTGRSEQIDTNKPSEGLERKKRAEQQGVGGRLASQNRGQSELWNENWYEVATRFCRISNGLSDQLHELETSDRVARLKSLGNAIVPQVAFEIMKSIKEIDK